MIVDIHGQGFTVTPALAEHMRRRLGFVLTRHSDRIQRVAIRVGDENGPRGGVDKYCRIQVQLLDAPVAVIKDVGAELYAVIDRAADRVGRVVVKRLDRTHPAREVARHGARPRRNRWESLQSGHAQGDMA
jgi:putative sigma-54 modulation protein